MTRASRSRPVDLAEAKAKLSELVERASAGEEIVLQKRGKPVAVIAPFGGVRLRRAGVLKTAKTEPIPYTLFAPMEGEELAWWEGEFTDPAGLSLPPRALAERRVALGFSKGRRPRPKRKA